MAEQKTNNINFDSSSESSDAAVTSLESIDIADVTDSSKCCRFPPSAHPIYIANILYFIPIAINGVVFNAVLYNKLCYQKFHNLSLCMNDTFTSSYPAIQAESVAWENYNSLAQIPIAVIMNLVLASYCDRVGHKLPYILPILGNFLATIYLALLATPQFLHWDISSIFGYSFMYNILGGSPTVVMSSFSYVALITPKEKMPITMVLCEGTLLVGALIGSFINGPIIDATSLSTLTYINAGITLVPLIVVAVFVTDVSSSFESQEAYTWKDALGFNRALEAFRCLFRKRDKDIHLMLHFSFAACTCIYFASSGSGSVNFFYFVKERGMTMSQYSVFSGFTTAALGLIGPAIIIIGRKYLKIERNNILMFSLSCGAMGYALTSVEALPYSEWIGGVFIGAQTAFYGVIRALQTGLVQPNELGRLFAYDGIIQLVFGAISSISVRALYGASLVVWPSMYLALTSLLFICAMIFIAILDRLQLKNGIVDIYVQS